VRQGNRLRQFPRKRSTRSIEAMRHKGTGSLRPAAFYPEKNGKLRPLGLPNMVRSSGRRSGSPPAWKAYYEPGFSGFSPWFRRIRGVKSAAETQNTWTETYGFVEGESWSTRAFVSLTESSSDQGRERQGPRPPVLIPTCSKPGTLKTVATMNYSRCCPQGGVVSRIRSNIYLHNLRRICRAGTVPIHPGTSRGRIQDNGRDSKILKDAKDRGIGQKPVT